ncbi:phosphate signaling complex protein PhoU [Cytobacillus oceanisediminis]|jgi:phosphate transport system protein|uniref:Phosphate-specific transport system accessory protein PhoU n=2 Tax=Niallia TaxID=2837506 RepID=A0A941JGT7_NIACI|nr:MULTISPECIES: phosphate signaling complex protein PhoU [Bacillaceae]EOR23961.1 phosphate uptake regulator [Niallia nealsonii AAU1]MBQ6448500.1 phosphate signaling complex protein PhoU [Bacillus sp. (in: firmicutes)]MDU1848070.1 phosphate signaling complex protein PhoU [Niallia nealsonii]MBZ9534140.1 phosphate signaling complex protein PhoU [Cytobacillus oceanisediminis]MCB5236920.1 phosphate signaling complex protein PhoU [Niallia circulans]
MVIRENFEKKLEELKGKISEMGEMSIASLEEAFDALKTQDVEIALNVIEEDTDIDNLESEINHFAIWLMAKEQPVARDLRVVIGVIKISSEIERVADFAVNIAKATIKIGKTPSLLDITQLERMKELSIEMLKKAIKSFIEEDIVLAKEISKLEDQVDDYYLETYKKLTAYLSEHPEETNQLVQLLFINRYLERTADHITNMAESTGYLIKGKIYDFNS